MKNSTRTKIIVSMRHYDHAVRLTRFLEEVSRAGKEGGDLMLSCNGKEFMIGHDVEGILSVDHLAISDSRTGDPRDGLHTETITGDKDE